MSSSPNAMIPPAPPWPLEAHADHAPARVATDQVRSTGADALQRRHRGRGAARTPSRRSCRSPGAGRPRRGHQAVLALVAPMVTMLGTLGLPIALTYAVAQSHRRAAPVLARLLPLIAVQGVALVPVHALALWLLMDHDEALLVPAALSLLMTPLLVVILYALAILQGLERSGSSTHGGWPAPHCSARVFWPCGCSELGR